MRYLLLKSSKPLLFGALVSLMVLTFPPAWADGSEPDGLLVSASEAVDYKGEAGFNEPTMLRTRAVVPMIEILKPEPTTDLKVTAPFAIQVQFRGLPDAEILPDTFKVLYGGLKIDITSRITKYVKVTADGFTLDNAKIPPGKHRLTLHVEDSKQRAAERDLRVEVE